MRRLRQEILKMAPNTATVLILGECGTGKELVARALHEHSPRRTNKFVAVNCGALNENMLDDEMFGHEKNAFTGADKDRMGRFEYAKGGTLFLDEVGDMTPSLQVKLLRVLENQEVTRIGGNEPISVDVRVIAATNRPLEVMVREEKFRQDLYYRLCVLDLCVPALRERGMDVMLLADHYLSKHAKSEEKVPARFTAEAEHYLKQHSWPGNVRELISKIRRAVALATLQPGGIEVGPDDLRLLAATVGGDNQYDNQTAQAITLADVTRDMLINENPPMSGLRHGDDGFGNVATRIKKELVDGFAAYLRTEKGTEQLSKYPDKYFITLFGLGSRKNLKHRLMADLYNHLAEVLNERRQELSPFGETKQRDKRRKQALIGD